MASNSPTVKPSLKDAQRHIELLTGSADTEMYFRFVDDDKIRTKLLPRHNFGPCTVDALWSTIEEYQADGFAVYIVVNEGGHKAADITRIRSQFIDCDGTSLLWETDFHIPPTFICKRSETHWHAWWRVDGNVPVDKFTQLQLQLAAQYGTDDQVRDLPRIMRLAGTVHQKVDKDGTKHPPTLITIEEGSGEVYDGWEIAAGLPDLPPEPERSTVTGDFKLLPLAELKEWLTYVSPFTLAPDHRHKLGRDDWRDIIAAIHQCLLCPVADADGNELGEDELRELARSWSAGKVLRADGTRWKDPHRVKADDTEVDDIFRTMPPREKGKGTGPGTIFKFACAAGYKPPRPSVKAFESVVSHDGMSDGNVIRRYLAGARLTDNDFVWNAKHTAKSASAHLQNIVVALSIVKICLRYDEFSDVIYMRRGDGPERRVDDKGLAQLRQNINTEFELNVPAHVFKEELITLAQRRAFHPVRDNLAECQAKWDRKPRIDTWLIKHLGADDTPLNRAISRLVLIAAVRRIRQPGVKFDTMLVLCGAQGLGKSTVCRILAGAPDTQSPAPWCSDAVPLGADRKTTIELTMGKFIVEAAELSGMRAAENERIKGFLSAQTDEARLSYDRLRSDRPRQFIIIGSTNDEHVLKDPTGARRFWPVKVRAVVDGMFDTAGLLTVRDQLWGEAAELESQGASITLDRSLWDAAAKVAEAHTMADSLQEPLESLVAGIEDGRVQAMDVYKALGFQSVGASAYVMQRVKRVMESLGWIAGKPRFAGRSVSCFDMGAGVPELHSRFVDGRWQLRAADVTGRTRPKMATVNGVPVDDDW